VQCMCVEACCAGAEAQKKEGTKMHIWEKKRKLRCVCKDKEEDQKAQKYARRETLMQAKQSNVVEQWCDW
jgi:hypothetical protein